MTQKEDKVFLGVFSMNGLKASIPWILLIIGGVCLYFGYFYIFQDEKSLYIDLCRGLANILIVGVLVGFVTSSAQFMGVFKKELEAIIYESKFLKNRIDIHKVWDNVSCSLFRSKFPEISNDLLHIIKNQYLPLNQVSYYKDYQSIITISWADKERKIIKVVYEISFDLTASSKDKFNFPLDSRVNVDGLSKSDYSISIENYLVNNKEAKIVKIIDEIENGDTHHYGIEVELAGSTKYSISKKVIKQYSYEKDYFIAFAAKFIVKDFRIQVFHPADIELCFINRGLINKFKDVKKRETYLEKQYKGLILQKQGYVIILKNKENETNN